MKLSWYWKSHPTEIIGYYGTIKPILKVEHFIKLDGMFSSQIMLFRPSLWQFIWLSSAVLPKPRYVRVNTLKIDTEAAVQELERIAKVFTYPHSLSCNLLVIIVLSFPSLRWQVLSYGFSHLWIVYLILSNRCLLLFP